MSGATANLITHVEGYLEHDWAKVESSLGLRSRDVDNDEFEGLDEAHAGEFVHACEEEFARTLDDYGIRWQYKPRTFAVEWDDEGNFVDSLTPGFYLPVWDTYLELAAPQSEPSNSKPRLVRLLRRQYPDIRIEIVATPAYWMIAEKFLGHPHLWNASTFRSPVSF